MNNNNIQADLAVVFPGQGSQAVGMLKDLAAAFPIVGETFSEAATVLSYDLWQLVQQGPAEQLNQTDKTQPAMLAAGVACWRVWLQQGGAQPAVMAGHSLGEYTALVCAGALAFSDAISLVADRGRFMQQAVPAGEGAMAAILGLADEQVISLCDEAAAGEVVAAVNFNSPGQVVIAGNHQAVERALELAKTYGAKRALLLPVSVPSHCLLMQPAADLMRQRLQSVSISRPQIPVINNVDVQSCDTAEAIQDALVRQLYNPVRWVETIRQLEQSGIELVIECGPGKVLAGLNKRIVKTMQVAPFYDPASLGQALELSRVDTTLSSMEESS